MQAADNVKNKARVQKFRQNRTSEEQVAEKEKHRAEQKKYLSGCKAHVDKKEGLMSNGILTGVHTVPDLKDTDDTIGHSSIQVQEGDGDYLLQQWKS